MFGQKNNNMQSPSFIDDLVKRTAELQDKELKRKVEYLEDRIRQLEIDLKIANGVLDVLRQTRIFS